MTFTYKRSVIQQQHKFSDPKIICKFSMLLHELRNLVYGKFKIFYGSPSLPTHFHLLPPNCRVGDRRVAYRFLVVRPERKLSPGRPRHRWEDEIKWIFQKLGEVMDWIDLAQVETRDRLL